MRRFKMAVVALVTVSAAIANVNYRYTGTVSDKSGKPLAGALVSVPATGVIVTTDAEGKYALEGEIQAAAVSVHRDFRTAHAILAGRNMRLSLPEARPVGVSVYRLSGRLVSEVPEKTYPAGEHTIALFHGRLPSSSYIVKITSNGTVQVIPVVLTGRTGVTGINREAVSLASSASPAIASTSMPQLRASAAGYRSADTLSSGYTGTYDFTLEQLASQTTGTAGQEDGSLDRLVYWGKEQFFWGDANGTGNDMPLVKIVTAVSDDAVDIALIFNPGFVDNTYGTGKIGWNKHTFEQLVKSDHVALSVRNGDGTEVFAGKIDMISVCADVPSGYATLGPYGGDGTITTGSKEDILSFGTSMDDNINYYGYELLENSPKTDAVYTPNPDYPNWEYYAIYRISFDPEMFGPSGYGDVQMTSVHASPAKTKEETVTVTEKGPPGDSDDPFTHTHFGEPPVDITDPKNPPTDTTDNGGGNPPTDTTDNGGNPPTDTTDNGGDVPPDDVIETSGSEGGDPPSDGGSDTPVDKPPEDVLE